MARGKGLHLLCLPLHPWTLVECVAQRRSDTCYLSEHHHVLILSLNRLVVPLLALQQLRQVWRLLSGSSEQLFSHQNNFQQPNPTIKKHLGNSPLIRIRFTLPSSDPPPSPTHNKNRMAEAQLSKYKRTSLSTTSGTQRRKKPPQVCTRKERRVICVWPAGGDVVPKGAGDFRRCWGKPL